MKKRLKTILSLFVGFVLLVSCNPDDPKLSKSHDLISGTGKWVLIEQIITVESISSDNYTIDYYDIMDDCWKDNIFYYTSTNVYQELAAATKCDPIEPDIIQTGTWVLSPDGKQLSIQRPDGINLTITDILEVMELNKTTLKLKSVVELNADTFTTVYTYAKQQ